MGNTIRAGNDPLWGLYYQSNSFNELDKNSPYNNASKTKVKKTNFSAVSAMKIALVGISALTLGIIFVGMYAHHSAKGAVNENICLPDEAPSLGGLSFVNQTIDSQTLKGHDPTPVHEVLIQNTQVAVQAIVAGTAAFSESAMGLVSSGLETGQALVNDIKAAAVNKYYAIPKKLDEVTISEADQKVLEIRSKYPAYFNSGFIFRLFGNESATAKAITLGAALGETSKPISQLYFLNKRCAGKCPLGLMENIRSFPTSLGEDQSSINKVIGRVDPKVFTELEAAHKAQVENAPDLVNYNFMMRPEPVVEGSFTEVGIYLGDAGWPRGSIMRDEYGDSSNAYDTRASYSVIESYDKEEGSGVTIIRDVSDSHKRGKAASAWDKFFIDCKFDSEEIQCKSSTDGVKHAYGEMEFALNEKRVSSVCSLISEAVKSNFGEKVYKYAINPTKKLPILFSQMTNSLLFSDAKKSSFSSLMTGDIDAIAAFSTELPDGLPKDCQELYNLEHPKLGIA